VTLTLLPGQDELTLRPGPDGFVIEIGVGGIGIAEHPERLMTPALGSCVGVAIWDPVCRRGGLAHVMLPAPTGASADPENGRFASWAVPRLVEMLLDAGSERADLRAKLAGGAAMFQGSTGVANVGERNVAEVKRQLLRAEVELVGEDTGGNHARTVELHLDSGLLVVRSYRLGTSEL
jgi:chemotaxis protein CheD